MGQQREVILVLGKTGSGKTTWARNYIKTLSRVIVAEAGYNEFDIIPCPTFDSLIDKIEKEDKGGRGIFRVSYTPLYHEQPMMFDVARCTKNVHLVIEEADRYDDPRSCEEYDEIISRGRHYGVSIIGISLYPAKIPASLRSQASRVICFRQHEPKDVKYFYDVIGEAADQLPTLGQFEFLDWTPTGLTKGKL